VTDTKLSCCKENFVLSTVGVHQPVIRERGEFIIRRLSQEITYLMGMNEIKHHHCNKHEDSIEDIEKDFVM
jgi:hypothetical protein